MKTNKKELSTNQREELLGTLKARFDANKGRHPGLAWAKVQARLEAKPDRLWSLATGGEPDVVASWSSGVSTLWLDTRKFFRLTMANLISPDVITQR